MPIYAWRIIKVYKDVDCYSLTRNKFLSNDLNKYFINYEDALQYCKDKINKLDSDTYLYHEKYIIFKIDEYNNIHEKVFTMKTEKNKEGLLDLDDTSFIIEKIMIN